MRRSLLALLLSLAVAAPSVALAEEPPFTIGSRPIWFLTAGVTAGATVALDDKGAFVGGELSLTRLRDRHYLGIYGDAFYDWAVGGTYVTLGPELGVLKRALFPVGVGIDGGAALRVAGATDVGGTGRLFATLGTGFALYARYTHFGTAANEQVVQVGLTLKMPLGNSF